MKGNQSISIHGRLLQGFCPTLGGFIISRGGTRFQEEGLPNLGGFEKQPWTLAYLFKRVEQKRDFEDVWF